jgi:hypothetical protein
LDNLHGSRIKAVGETNLSAEIGRMGKEEALKAGSQEGIYIWGTFGVVSGPPEV